jgi:tetratricopeptide (TPR) repeat protein
MPAELSERAAAYRSMLAGKRMLIVLDNARSAEQVRELLPGSPSCVVVVTSRDRLAGLVARHGARRLELDVLPPRQAVALLRALIGRRVDADPDAARMLAARCARLPLALRVAAELATSSPAVSLRVLAGELADEQRRLELLDASGDPRTMVRSVFSWSYRHLPAAAARSFRLLGLHPGPDLDLHAAMALSGATEEQARSALDALAGTYLIQGTRGGRYALHDLLRAYAVSLMPDPVAGRDEARAALTRLLDYYLATAAAAMESLAPAERNRRPAVPSAAPPGRCPPVAEPVSARAWLDAERAVLVAVTAYAACHGWPDHATRLAATLSRYLVTGGHNSDAITIHEHALAAARRGGDRRAEATALINLGEVRWRLGYPVHQGGHFEQVLAILREVGDRAGEARAHGNLALLAWRQGRYAEAADHYDQALALFGEIGDQAGQARALDNLGAICCRQGRHEQAVGQHERALALFGEIGDQAGQARAFANLGWARKRQGFLAEATDHLERSLELSRAIGDRACEAEALSDLGAAWLRRGRCRPAADSYQRAIVLFREMGHQGSEAEALNGSGEVLLATCRPGEARAEHIAALDLAVQIDDKYQQAGAHHGLARSHLADGNRAAARHHWRHALALYAQLDVPEASAVLGHLAALDRDDALDLRRRLGQGVRVGDVDFGDVRAEVSPVVGDESAGAQSHGGGQVGGVRCPQPVAAGQGGR